MGDVINEIIGTIRQNHPECRSLSVNNHNNNNSILPPPPLQPSLLSEWQAYYLVEALEENTHMQEIYVEGCLWKGESTTWTCHFLERLIDSSSRLTAVHLGWNYLNDVHAAVIASSLLLSNNSPIRVLDLHDNCIGDDGVIALANALQRSNNGTTNTAASGLQALDLSRNEFGLRGLEAILSSGSCLKSLDLSDNCIGSGGFSGPNGRHRASQAVRIIANGVANNNTNANNGKKKKNSDSPTNSGGGEHDEISSIDDGSKGGRRGLHELWLCDNALTDDDICYLASNNGLAGNNTICELYLRNNCFGEVGAKALVRTLQINIELVHVDLDMNLDVPKRYIEMIEHLCEMNRRNKSNYTEMRRDYYSQKRLPRGLWPNALERISTKPDYVYHMLRKALHPELI